MSVNVSDVDRIALTRLIDCGLWCSATERAQAIADLGPRIANTRGKDRSEFVRRLVTHVLRDVVPGMLRHIGIDVSTELSSAKSGECEAVALAAYRKVKAARDASTSWIVDDAEIFMHTLLSCALDADKYVRNDAYLCEDVVRATVSSVVKFADSLRVKGIHPSNVLHPLTAAVLAAYEVSYAG